MSNIQKQHKISPAIAWLTIQKFIIFYCPLDGEHTISAGDADNDISMLQTTPVSVVMKNADSHMHTYATYITEHDNNHDGVAEAIYKFMI